MSTWNTEPPEDDRMVLCKDKDNDYAVCYYHDYRWQLAMFEVDYDMVKVTHGLHSESIVWQELPK